MKLDRNAFALLGGGAATVAGGVFLVLAITHESGPAPAAAGPVASVAPPPGLTASFPGSSSGAVPADTVVPAPTAVRVLDTRGPGTPAAGAVTTRATGRGVTAGAFCSPEGASGRTATGLLMRCERRAGETRARWRAVEQPPDPTPVSPKPVTPKPVTPKPVTPTPAVTTVAPTAMPPGHPPMPTTTAPVEATGTTPPNVG